MRYTVIFFFDRIHINVVAKFALRLIGNKTKVLPLCKCDFVLQGPRGLVGLDFSVPAWGGEGGGRESRPISPLISSSNVLGQSVCPHEFCNLLMIDDFSLVSLINFRKDFGENQKIYVFCVCVWTNMPRLKKIF